MVGEMDTTARIKHILTAVDFCIDKFATKKKVNDLFNSISIPTKLGDFINDVNYATITDVDKAIKDSTSALKDTLSIPTKVGDLENDVGYITNDDLDNKINEIEIPTKLSELENDSNFQTIKDVQDAIDAKGYQTADDVNSLIIEKNYVTESQVNETIGDINIPEKVSELENDAGYLTSVEVSESISTAIDEVKETSIPKNISELTNDLGYQTESDIDKALANIKIPENVSEFTNDSGYLTETTANTLIDGKGFQTADDVEEIISNTTTAPDAIKDEIQAAVDSIEIPSKVRYIVF